MQGTTNNEPSGQDEIKASNDDATSSGWTLDGFDACSAMLLEEDSKPNWDTLQSIETRRRYILDKVEQPVWRILVRHVYCCCWSCCFLIFDSICFMVDQRVDN
ncbi:MAG: hypothetical protein ACI8RD_007079 [Bacillariaceae sp.]|jgi:hypothetical protein